MNRFFLAVDIGASSGRHILGHQTNGKLVLEEVYRFENGMINKDGKILWDTKHIFQEIVTGMKRCAALGKIPSSMSVDTWAVDYVLLDEKDQVLGDTYGYRDHRTDGMENEVYQTIGEQPLYARTGIQKQSFNTIYQLMAVKKNAPALFGQAKTFLMLPDYFQFLLTGNKASEYTNATSTQLVNPQTKQWDEALIQMLGYPREIFLPLRTPGTALGHLTKEIQQEVGYDLEVMLCASHDTASAVMAVPKADGAGLYISSGTWSLMGIESDHAIITEEGRKANFTNEGGYQYRYRYLKNIMGLWMIQSVRREQKNAFSFAKLCEMAEECKDFPSRVDVNSEAFLSPKCMTDAIRSFCADTGQIVPKSTGELAAVIYQSLAKCYGETVCKLEKAAGRSFDSIQVIGGGSNADYLNQLTANATGKTVLAGPKEATAIGNLMAQMIEKGEFADLSAARKCVLESFAIQVYKSAKA